MSSAELKARPSRHAKGWGWERKDGKFLPLNYRKDVDSLPSDKLIAYLKLERPR